MNAIVDPELRTLFAAFARSAARHPDNSCLCIPPRAERDYHSDGLERTYGEVMAEVLDLQRGYRAAGYGHGHRVALLLENRPEFVFHWLALNSLGAAVVPINPDYRAAEIFRLLEHSEADLAVVLDRRLQDFREICRTLPRPLDAVGVSQSGADLPAARRQPRPGPPDLDTEMALLYTSGTIGLPKGCLLTNRYTLFAGERYVRFGGLAAVEPGRERLYNPLPLFYANSLGISNAAMLLSANCMIFPDRFHPGSWWQDLCATRATIVHTLGIIPPILLRQAPVPEEREHRVRFGIGAGIDPAEHARFEQRFGFPLIEVWGMTEVGICSAANVEPRRIETRSIGRPVYDVEMMVAGDDGEPVGDGEPGELLVRRAGLEPRTGFFAGYLKDGIATEEAWRGGWFHTGDIACRVGEEFFFVDRKKHMIRRSGQNISAAEVEAAVKDHPAVAQIAVVPVPDELRQEEVMACIVAAAPVDDPADLAQSIVAWALERLAYYKAPGWVLFVSDLPRTSTQKLQKTQIFAPGEDPRRRPDCLDMRDRKQRPRPAQTARAAGLP